MNRRDFVKHIAAFAGALGITAAFGRLTRRGSTGETIKCALYTSGESHPVEYSATMEMHSGHGYSACGASLAHPESLDAAAIMDFSDASWPTAKFEARVMYLFIHDGAYVVHLS